MVAEIISVVSDLFALHLITVRQNVIHRFQNFL